MKKRTRTIIFIVCVVLFASAAPSVVLYSQGYRLDFENKKIVQTGGLYFKVLPSGANIYLNGKFNNKTSFFTNSLLTENLLPKTYSVEISKEGYYSWQKNLEVKEKQVTEAKNIILIPKEPVFTKLNQEPLNILSKITTSATTSDKKKVIEPNEHEIWIFFPKGQADPFGEETGEKVFLTRFSEKIGRVFWLNNDYLIFNVEDKIKILEVDSRDKLNIVEIAEFKTPEIFWSREDNKLYVLSGNDFYVAENLLP